MNNNTAQSSQPEGHDKPVMPVPVLPSREVITEHQMNVLLALMHHFQPYLLLPGHLRDEDGLPPKLDGGVHAAAVSAFSAVCQKVEELLAQKKRWNTKTHDDLYTNVVKLQRAHIKLAIEQTVAAQEIRKPSYCLKPTVRLVEGHFIATWGDVTVTGGTIVGHGATPALALEDFNAAFNRTPNEMIQFIASLDNPAAMKNNPHKKPRNEDSE